MYPRGGRSFQGSLRVLNSSLTPCTRLLEGLYVGEVELLWSAVKFSQRNVTVYWLHIT